MRFALSKTASIEFQSLPSAQQKNLARKLNQLARSGHVGIIPHLKRLSTEKKFVIKYGTLRVFCHFDLEKHLVVTGIINNESLQYIYE